MRRSFLLTVSFLALLLGVAVATNANASGAPVGVSASPRLDVLQVVDGEVLDSTVVGNRVILVGTFTKVKNPGGGEISQPYIAAYNIDTGAFDAGFRPAFNKAAYAVDTDGTYLYVGGNFSTINGATHRKVAKLQANGDLISAFDPQVGANVNDVALANGKLYLAGRFTEIDGQPRAAFAAVNASTGELDNTIDFSFTFSVASGGGITGKSIAITPDSSKLFLSHTARFIEGQERTAIARFNISTNTASLSNWQTNLYDDELDRFGGALRPRRLAMSPDGSFVVMVNSGGDRPPAGDTAVRFPVSGGADTQADWVSRHFDTVLGVAISDDTVFVGGHFQFQEAPGSSDPFPGDKFTNYGFGQAQGPAVLGDEVVRRQQLGALDPNTGKSLLWNPGSNSFLGVQSLTFVDGKGLLVGHDGDTLGGVEIGRHALFPIGNDPEPPGGDYACTVTADGGAAVISFTGDRGTNEQLRRNGEWAGTVTGQATQRISNGAGDSYAVRVKGPGFDDPYSEIACTGGGGGGGTLETTITTPATGAVVQVGNVALSGEASAPSGIKRVRLTVVRKADGKYLNDNGSFTTGWAAVDVDLFTQDTSRTWTKSINLTQSGEYKLTAKTFANDGSKDASPAEVTFVVGNNNDDAPFMLLTGPDRPSAGNTAVVAGSATDDLGVSSVRFTMLDRNKLQYLQPDGSLGSAYSFTADLTNPGATSTNFSKTLTNVPAGEWDVRAEARDTSGQKFVRSRVYSQVGDTSPPTGAITSGADQKKSANSQFTFSGNAQAPAGMENVSVLIRDVLDYSGVGANGSVASTARYYILPGTNGGTSRNWSYQSPQLPVGTYDVFFKVTDSIGNSYKAETQIVVGPSGDDLPTTGFTAALRYQQGLNSLTTTIGGTASDDSGVAQVTIGIYDFTKREWLQTDGTTDNKPDPFIATLSSPGSQNTNWSYQFTAPRAGTYYFYVRAVDSAGQAAADRAFGSARVYPGDATPTVTVNLPTANQVLTNNRIAVAGSARDDNSVSGIEVLFRHVDTGLYLRRDGSMGSGQWIDGSLTNPGGDRSNFDYQTPIIADGTWDVTVRSVDNNGQKTTPTTRIRVTLT